MRKLLDVKWELDDRTDVICFTDAANIDQAVDICLRWRRRGRYLLRVESHRTFCLLGLGRRRRVTWVPVQNPKN